MVWALIAVVAVAAMIAGGIVFLCKAAKKGSVRFAKHSLARKKSFFTGFLVTSYFLRKKNDNKEK